MGDCISESMDGLQAYLDKFDRPKDGVVTGNTNIYRYMSKEHFLDMVENRWLTFAHISLWEDPFEGFLFKTGEDADTRRTMYAGFYGQSWTFSKSESDLRWRAYCPNKDGVRIKTTVGALRDLINRIIQPYECLAKVVDGPVVYIDDKTWNAAQVLMPQLYPKLFPSNRNEAASLLFLKRDLFKREREYRVIGHIGHAGLRELPDEDSNLFERKNGLLKCRLPYEIENLVDEVVVDPRMSIADVDRLKCRLVQSDCMLDVKQSDAYQWPDFKIN